MGKILKSTFSNTLWITIIFILPLIVIKGIIDKFTTGQFYFFHYLSLLGECTLGFAFMFFIVGIIERFRQKHKS